MKSLIFLFFFIFSLNSLSQTNSSTITVVKDTIYLVIPECGFKIESVEIFPNPTSDFSTITLTMKSHQSLNVEIKNKNNKTIFLRHFEDLSLITAFEIDTQDLSEGEYYININNGDENIVQKLIKR